MTSEAHLPLGAKHFEPAREAFDVLVAWLASAEAPMDHSTLERSIGERGREALRLLYQGRLDALSAAEREARRWAPALAGVQARSRTRQLETTLGRLRFKRVGLKMAGEPVRFQLDARLNLPAELYSHPLRERTADEARAAAFDSAVERIDQTTGGHVPKRQSEAIAITVTEDFDAFYAQSRRMPDNDSHGPDALLVASSDCKGVRMRPEALREATRKQAEAEAAEAVRGDPMAPKKPRRHDKRMAAITAVWEQQPEPRTAADIVGELRRSPTTDSQHAKKAPRPKPQRKRVSATVQNGIATAIGKMFDEVDQRDPARKRTLTVLVDGAEDQQTHILDQALARGRTVQIVLDLIHVLHYLWLAGFALCRKNAKATDAWVAQHLEQLLTAPVTTLIANIERQAAARRLPVAQRKAIDKALKYLRRNHSFLDYPTYLAHGLPIATGVIEGACRHLVQDRLGITGAKWGLPGAEAILRLRALRASNDWDDYWRFHEREEARRNYPAAA